MISEVPGNPDFEIHGMTADPSTQIGHYGIMKVRNDHIILINQVEVLIIFSSLVSNAEVFIIPNIFIKMMTRFSQHFKEDSFIWDRGRWFPDQHFQEVSILFPVWVFVAKEGFFHLIYHYWRKLKQKFPSRYSVKQVTRLHDVNRVLILCIDVKISLLRFMFWLQ